MIKRNIPGAPRQVLATPEPQNAAVSANPYAKLLELIAGAYGEPTYEMTIPGPPRGFTVARKRERTAGTQRSYLWAQESRAMLGHVYGIEHLSATADAPLFFWTAAWFGGGRHCDPENSHKLLKDALFYLCPHSKDKHTAGAFAGPLYDIVDPRTEVRVWRLVVSQPIVVPKKPVREPLRFPKPTREDIPRAKIAVSQTKVANPFGMLEPRK